MHYSAYTQHIVRRGNNILQTTKIDRKGEEIRAYILNSKKHGLNVNTLNRDDPHTQCESKKKDYT